MWHPLLVVSEALSANHLNPFEAGRASASREDNQKWETVCRRGQRASRFPQRVGGAVCSRDSCDILVLRSSALFEENLQK